MLVLLASILCLTSPFAVLYGFHARRHAPQKALAWAGLVLSLVVFVPFVMVMIGSAMNLKDMLCH